MAMKETVRSLRAYFILSGLASLWFGLVGLAVDLRASISPAMILATTVGIVGLGLALAFLYVGICLPGLLRRASVRDNHAALCQYRVGGLNFLAQPL